MSSVKVGIEVPVFLIFFALMLGAPVYTNFIIYRTCYVIMKKNESECAKLGLNTTDNSTNAMEKQVEPIANYISMSLDFTDMVIPCLLCIFIGPWSDKKGRRPILILTLTGFVIANGIRAIIAAMPQLNPLYLFLQSVPTMLTGGLPTFIMISFCYLVDVTNGENRGLRMGIIEGCLNLGMLLGTFCSAHLFYLVGYTGVFLVCAGLAAIAWLIIVVGLHETVQVTDDCSLFSLDNLKEMCHTTFKKRVGHNRLILLVGIFAHVLFVMAEFNVGVEGLLLRSKFNWDLEHVTVYRTMRSIVSVAGAVLGVYVLHSLLGVPELALIIGASCCCALNTLLVACAAFDWQIYVAVALRVMAAVVSPMVRSFLSKMIPHAEVAQVFAFGVALESLFGMIAGPIYMIIYTNTILTFPGAFDLVPFAFHVCNFILFTFIVILKSRSKNIVYLNIQEDLG